MDLESPVVSHEAQHRQTHPHLDKNKLTSSHVSHYYSPSSLGTEILCWKSLTLFDVIQHLSVEARESLIENYESCRMIETEKEIEQGRASLIRILETRYTVSLFVAYESLLEKFFQKVSFRPIRIKSSNNVWIEFPQTIFDRTVLVIWQH